jgi:hypothetical protein
LHAGNKCGHEWKIVYCTLHAIQLPTFRGTEWVRVEALVWGDEYIKHIVNGDTVLTYQKPQMGGGNVINYDSSYFKEGKL